jgi:hypothetical protein
MTEPTKYKAGDSKESGERCDHEYMCPNCVTPWRCNGPHLRDECVKCGDPGPLLPTPPPAEAKASASTEPAKAKDCRCASVMDGRGGMCPAHPPEPANAGLSDQERYDQRISFAYGNASADNPNITRETVEQAARKLYGERPAPGPDERSETGALNTAKGGEGLERIRKALEQDRIGHAAFHDTQPDSFCCSPMANGIASELLRLIEALTRGAKEWNYNDPGGANE